MRARVAIVTVALAAMLGSQRSAAQCNPACQGDLDSDGRVLINELITAVGNALNGCGSTAEQQGCLNSGGTVMSVSCCAAQPDFPDTCSIGSCGCAPQFSRTLDRCDCGEGRCFDREQRACVTR
jgi:hypothetical protein